MLEKPDGPGWVSFVVPFLPFVLAALAPEHRCCRVHPVGFDDIEVIPIYDLLADDGVAAVAATEFHLWLYTCSG